MLTGTAISVPDAFTGTDLDELSATSTVTGEIEVDVVVFAPAEPGRPRKILSLGEAKWDRVMDLRHVERLRRARDLLAVKGLDTRETVLSCYSGAGFSPELQAAQNPDIRLVGLDQIYAD